MRNLDDVVFATAGRLGRLQNPGKAVVPQRKPPPSATMVTTPLSDDQTAPLYLAMLQTPRVSRAALIAQGFTPAELDDLLPQLEARGMVQSIATDSWRVIPPDVALPAWAAQLEQHARLVRSAAQSMTRIYLRAQSPTRPAADAGIIPLSSMDQIAGASQQVLATAQQWAISARADSPLTRHLLQAPRERHATTFLNSQGEVLQTRLTVDPGLLGDPRIEEILHDRHAAGDEIRATHRLPFSGAVNDQGIALLDLEDRDGAPVGMLLNPKTGSDAVLRCLEFMWRLGVPWRPGGEPSTDRDSLDPRDRQIVRLMASGVSDLAIARQVGVSSRTVERRVRTVMDRLNASTRFQAGVLAAKNGLI